ncbi:MAG: tetratricopeptide repeat protein, partial [Chloroflexota bacterium]
PQTLHKLRVFVAAPGDVLAERSLLATVVAELNRGIAQRLGVVLELLDWRTQVAPTMGNAQQVILDTLPISTWDVLVGIVWTRFGAPVGNGSATAAQSYDSGTYEEFVGAYNVWRQSGKPRIMFYRCTRVSGSLDTLNLDDLIRIKNFFQNFESGGAHPGFYKTYDTPENFERYVREHLTEFLWAYSQQVLNITTQPPEAPRPSAPRHMNSLPRRAPFFGRTDEIAQCLRALHPQNRTWGIVVDGIGGIGKTALAVEVAYVCKEQKWFDDYVFITAKINRLTPAGIQNIPRIVIPTLDQFIDETAITLGCAEIARLSDSEKQQALLQALQTRKVLLVYDNLETLPAPERGALTEFLQFLPPHCKTIITSRQRGGDGAVWLRLEKIDWDTGLQIIRQECEHDARLADLLKTTSEAKWHELFDEAGGLPLALIWTLGLMRVKRLAFDGALELLRRGTGTGAELQKFIYEQSRKELGKAELAVLKALSLFAMPATAESLVPITALSPTALDTAIEHLSALSLVDAQPGGEAFTLHPLTRAYVHDNIDAKNGDDVLNRFVRYWLDYAREQIAPGDGREALEAEWNNLSAATRWAWSVSEPKQGAVAHADTGALLLDLAATLRYFLWSSGRWDESLELSARTYDVACALKAWDHAGWRAFEAAWIYYNRAQTDRAAEWSDKCAAAWQKQPSEYERATAIKLRGLIAQQRGQFEQAKQSLEESLAIYRQLQRDADVSIGLAALGDLVVEQRDFDAAETYYREAMNLDRAHNDEQHILAVLGRLANIALERGEWAKARELFTELLPSAEQINRQDLIVLAQYGLAYVLATEGQLAEAIPLAQSALAISEKLQHRDTGKILALLDRLVVSH